MRRFYLFVSVILFLLWVADFWIAQDAVRMPLSLKCPCSGVVRTLVAAPRSQEIIFVTDGVFLTVTLPADPAVAVSDTLVIDGAFLSYSLDEPSQRQDLVRGIRGTITHPIIFKRVPLSGFSPWISFLRMVSLIQHNVLRVLQQHFSPPESTLAIGIVIGEHERFSNRLRVAFRRTGLSHVVAVSGTNVTLLMVFLQPFFMLLPRRLRVPCGAFAIGIFVFVAGADPPVVRAAFMGVVSFFGLSRSRSVHPGRLLVSLFWCMAFWNPLQVVYDVSFQLSFVATAGLIFVSPSIDRFLERFIASDYLRQSLAVTLAAYIVTLPFSLFVFHQISWIAPVVNVVVEPLVPIAMVLVLVFLFLFFILPPLSLLVSVPLYTLLHVLIAGVLWCSDLPWVAFTW